MKKNLTALAVFLAGFVAGCRQVVEIDVPLSDQRLVLNSLFNPDSLMTGAVSYSRHILDGGRVLPAPVQIFIRDVSGNQPLTGPIKTLNGFGEILWEAPFRPLAGRTYELRVTDEAGKNASAVTTIPANVPIEVVSVDTVGLSHAEADLRVQIRFHDPPGQRNYYRLFGLFDSQGFFVPSGPNRDTVWLRKFTGRVFFRVNDTALGQVNATFGDLVFDDAFFDGREHSLVIRFTSNTRAYTNYRFFLQHLSPDYHQYITTRSLQYQTTGDPFAQPVLVYSNVAGGLGIVASYNQSVWFLR